MQEGLQKNIDFNGEVYEGIYKKGMQEGLHTAWYPNGQQLYKRVYKEGIQEE